MTVKKKDTSRDDYPKLLRIVFDENIMVAKDYVLSSDEQMIH